MKSFSFFFLLFSIGVSVVSLTGCGSSSANRGRYPSTSIGVAHSLENGKVIDVHDVVIDGRMTMAGVYDGAVGGSVLGGAFVADIGGTHTSAAVGAAGGAILGAVVGPRIEKAMTSKVAQELTIRMEEGDVIVVVQERRDPEFMIGDTVRVRKNAYDSTRIFHSDEDPFVDPDTGAYLPEDFKTAEL